MGRKIAIVGTAPSKTSAPFGDPSWEIWACSPGNIDLPRVDTFFEIHAMDKMERDPNLTLYLAWMRRVPKRLFLHQAEKRWPNSQSFPWREVLEEFGPFFFTSSIAEMMALAILERPTMIGIFGVNMSALEEYREQKMGCQHFIQVALDRGIEVYAPPESEIFNPEPVYALCEQNRLYRNLKAREIELSGIIDAQGKQIRHLQESIQAHHGALEQVRWFLRNCCGVVEIPEVESGLDVERGFDEAIEPTKAVEGDEDEVSQVFQRERDAG